MSPRLQKFRVDYPHFQASVNCVLCFILLRYFIAPSFRSHRPLGEVMLPDNKHTKAEPARTTRNASLANSVSAVLTLNRVSFNHVLRLNLGG